MPNVKIYVDETLLDHCRTNLLAVLSPMRDLLCQDLSVDTSACQFAVLRVVGMDGQPGVNIELMILPKAERTREMLMAVGGKLRAMVGEATGAHVAVRVATLDPQTFLALK